jgi:2-iminobutanoate/2-iminopropanoate deaminase
MARPQPVQVPGVRSTGLPYSSGMISGNLVYTAGHGGYLSANNEPVTGIEAQTERCLEALGSVLKAAGTDFEHVIKVNVYLGNVRDFDAMNQVYRRYFPSSPPARTTVGVSFVRSDMLIEIEMVAALP